MNTPPQPDDSNMHAEGSLEATLTRLEDLESRLAWQEDWLERLDETLNRQAATLDRVERLCNLMQTRLREQRSALDELQHDQGGAPEHDERPPHY
ncbi:SlyX protein [Kushneria sinocarnis]|uniref:SlyX protein n=1 Tax=Kushneria sinocarnis TaxID=595502 RepID=A0A420WXI8_9GAMM|nr:SlyX family protein [Kushneria sinocarnis]RKR04455.1 SlyX protein [Kushneria sinocarnis]